MFENPSKPKTKLATLLLLVFLSFSCESRHSSQPELLAIESRASWTESALDKYLISLLSSTDDATGYESMNGRIAAIFSSLAEDVTMRFAGNCGADFVQSHYLFYRESDESISLIVYPRSVPDETNQYREVIDRNGNRKLAITLLPGARMLPGCRLEYRFDKFDNRLAFIRELR